MLDYSTICCTTWRVFSLCKCGHEYDYSASADTFTLCCRYGWVLIKRYANLCYCMYVISFSCIFLLIIYNHFKWIYRKIKELFARHFIYATLIAYIISLLILYMYYGVYDRVELLGDFSYNIGIHCLNKPYQSQL